jgi:translation initiation factor 2B subunit (eIF-2B alpha/beta/delta family)
MSADGKIGLDILSRQVAYSGEGISVKSLEAEIHQERTVQDNKVGELKELRERNVEIAGAMTEELKKLRKFSDYLDGTATKDGFWAGFKEIMSFIPGLRSLAISQRSIEELLKQQYQVSARRVKEAAEYVDHLKQSEQDLYKEIDRINVKIVEMAKNEQVALDYVLELRELETELKAQEQALTAGSVEARDIQAQIDKVFARLSEHSSNVQLYGSAEERYVSLKANTRKLLETIRNLGQDIQQYTTAASIKLDMASAQIQAIGRAADASVVMLEMKRSLDVMTESMNVTTQFVSDTQVFFRSNLDTLMDELDTFDETTTKVLDENLAKSREIEEQRIQAAIDKAMRKSEGGGAPAPEATPGA